MYINIGQFSPIIFHRLHLISKSSYTYKASTPNSLVKGTYSCLEFFTVILVICGSKLHLFYLHNLSKNIRYLIYQLNPITFLPVDVLPQTIRIKVF